MLVCFVFILVFHTRSGHNNSDNLTEMLYGLNEIMSLKQLSQCLTYHNLSIQVNYYGSILTKAILICNQKGISKIPWRGCCGRNAKRKTMGWVPGLCEAATVQWEKLFLKRILPWPMFLPQASILWCNHGLYVSIKA